MNKNKSGISSPSRRPTLLHLYLELAKARLSALVVFTTATGYLLAGDGPTDWWRFFWTVLGTYLAATAANALNQWWEVRRDSLMDRTRNRPLPTGQLSTNHALVLGVGVGLAGDVILLFCANGLTALLSLICQLLYILVYTPMKPRSSLCTLVGAVCGGIPPMMGWTAVTGRLDYGAWILGTTLFIWQIPHFLALAWLYRKDYERGGFRMLPIIDTTGQLTCRVILLYCLALLFLGPAVTLAGLAGWVYTVGSIALGAWMLSVGVRLYRDRTDINARRLFLASVIYLPLVLVLMIADRGPISGLPQPAGAVTALRPASLPVSVQGRETATVPLDEKPVVGSTGGERA